MLICPNCSDDISNDSLYCKSCDINFKIIEDNYGGGANII